jgi:hypothetical protein
MTKVTITGEDCAILVAKMVVDVLEGLNKDYIIKEDLKRYL